MSTRTEIKDICEQKTCNTEALHSVFVPVEETVQETITSVTEIVSEMHDAIIPTSDSVQLEEVVVESVCTSVEPAVALIPPSSESSTAASSPIEISGPTE